MEPSTDELTSLTLALEEPELILLLLSLGNLVTQGLDLKQISAEDFVIWEKLLNKILKTSGIPLEAQTFLRKMDVVAAILAE